MKTIVILQTLIGFVSFVMSIRAISLFLKLHLKIRKRSLNYMMSDYQTLQDKAGMWEVIAMIVINWLISLNGINRIILHFPPYISAFVFSTSIVIHICIFVVSFCQLLSYDEKLSALITRKK